MRFLAAFLFVCLSIFLVGCLSDDACPDRYEDEWSSNHVVLFTYVDTFNTIDSTWLSSHEFHITHLETGTKISGDFFPLDLTRDTSSFQIVDSTSLVHDTLVLTYHQDVELHSQKCGFQIIVKDVAVQRHSFTSCTLYQPTKHAGGSASITF